MSKKTDAKRAIQADMPPYIENMDGARRLVVDLVQFALTDLRAEVYLTDTQISKFTKERDKLRRRAERLRKRAQKLPWGMSYTWKQYGDSFGKQADRLNSRLNTHTNREANRADAQDFFERPERCQPWLDFLNLEQSRVAAKLGLTP